MQSKFWGLAKKTPEKQPEAFDISWKGWKDSLLVFIQRVNGQTSLTYVPWAPTFYVPEEERGFFLEELSLTLQPYLPDNCLCIRYDLPWDSPYGGGTEVPPDRIRELRMNFGTRTKNLRKAPTNIQPVHTRIIDITGDGEALLRNMRAKTRYNIRLSRRRGVEVKDASYDRLPEWYRLYQETVLRNGIYPHSYRQFEKLLKTKKEYDLPNTGVHLLFAQKNSEALAGMILVLHGSTAMYLYGASGSHKRHLMPTYRLQWEAIRLAREHNCIRYDLFGIPPDESPGHPMHGLYRFKTGFGGYTLRRQGCWDFPLKKEEYTHFAGVEPAEPGYHQR